MIGHNPFNPVTQLIVKRAPEEARRYLKFSKLGMVELAYFLSLPEALFDKAPGLETALGGSLWAGNMLSSARQKVPRCIWGLRFFV
jgi:hypothetical protein